MDNHETKKVRKIKIIIVSAILFAVLIFIVVRIVLFTPYPVSYDELNGIEIIKKNGITSFHLDAAKYGNFMGGKEFFIDNLVYLDLNSNIMYNRYYIYYHVSRWNRWFNKGVVDSYTYIRDDGSEVNVIDETQVFDKNGTEFVLKGHIAQIFYGEICDSSAVLLWECENFKQETVHAYTIDEIGERFTFGVSGISSHNGIKDGVK